MNDLMKSIEANKKDDVIFNGVCSEQNISMPDLKNLIMEKYNMLEQEAKNHIQSGLERGLIGLGKNLKATFGIKGDLVNQG